MADNFNTFKNIGDTVSFDSLYRGIENMGKAIASARAAKAKAEAKKNDELMKMVYQKNMETGKTPLQGIKNYQDFTSFLTTATNNIASDPNAGMNTVNLLFADYLTKSQLTTQQSNEEKKIRDGYSEGKAVSPEVITAFDKAYEAGGNMQWFTDPNNELDLARQGIFVTPDKSSEVNVNGKKFYQWGYISTSLSKAKNLTDELNKANGNISNYDVTSEVGNVKDLKGGKRGQQTVEMVKKYTLKPGKKEEIADQYSNDLEIQRFYLVNEDLFENKVKPNLLSIQKLYPNMSLQEQLGLAAKQTIKYDVLAHNFDYKDPSTQVLSGPNVTNVTVNNKQNIIDNTALKASTDPKKIKGARALDAINTQAQLNEIAAKLKKNGDKPVRDKFNGKDIVYIRVGPKMVDAYYLEDATEQSAGFQTQKQKQGQGTGSFIYTPGSMSSELGFYDPETLASVNESEVSKIMKEGTIDDVVKIKGDIYLKYTKTIKDEKGISLANENFYYVKMRKDGRLDRAVSSQYENSNGKKVTSMYNWDGWNAESNNAATQSLND